MQRSINDVAVTSDPTDVGGTPIGVLFLKVEYPLCGDVGADGISAGRMHDTLGLSGCSRGVEDVKRVLGVERLGRAIIGGFRHQLMPPVVAAGCMLIGVPVRL